MAQLPLEGIRVLDFGHVWAGPVLGHVLADMGAEVIKIESATHLDVMRRMRPFIPDWPRDDPDGPQSFLTYARNKLGVTFNITEPRAVELFKRLVAISDVVTENYSPRVMGKYGMDYQSLREVNPRLVMISLPALGQYGPWRHAVTYGNSLSSLTGLASVTGYRDGSLVTDYAYCDPNSGILGAFAVLTALRHRNRTGEGQYIDVAQGEMTACLLAEPFLDYAMNGRVAGPQGPYNANMAPHNNYRCQGQDKWLSIAVKTEEEWRSLCQVLGNPPWTQDAKFADLAARLEHLDELDEHISQWTINYTHEEAMEILQRAGVAAAPCYGIGSRFLDPHFQERENFVTVEHPKVGAYVTYGMSWKFSDTPGSIRRPPPLLGQHNDYVFLELLQLPRDEYERLKEEKVIY